jgi:hypothetical protein
MMYQAGFEDWFQQDYKTEFFNFRDFIDECTRKECKTEKHDADGAGICIHDLESLLRGHDSYSRSFLKKEKRKWHPDTVGKHCRNEEARPMISKKAGWVFDMFTKLLEACPPNESDNPESKGKEQA